MNICDQKIIEARPQVRLLCLDFDGTVVDGQNYKLPQAMSLFGKILSANKDLAIITARAATAMEIIAPSIKEILKKSNNITRCFIAGGNGTMLYELTGDKILQIYSFGLAPEEIKYIVEIGNKIYRDFNINNDDLNPKGTENFKKFLSNDWTGYIPSEIIDVCRPYSNAIFTEEAKVSFVLPKDKSLHEKLVNSLRDVIGENYQISVGDEVYMHITKKLSKDGKKYAVEQILSILKLKENEVATFGDMPDGNDAGLLSFSYSFTNSAKDLGHQPPYVLDWDLGPIARIYKAVDNLIS